MIRAAVEGDFDAILALNRESEHFMNALDADDLVRLHRAAAYHRVAVRDGRVVGFLLALREAADYDYPAYRWFIEHYPRFLYIDRIAVGAAPRRGVRASARGCTAISSRSPSTRASSA